MPAISAVFTISHVAELLGEDAEWLHEVSTDMKPEDGCLWIYGIGEHGVPGFTEYGIECLKDFMRELRGQGKRPRPKGS